MERKRASSWRRPPCAVVSTSVWLVLSVGFVPACSSEAANTDVQYPSTDEASASSGRDSTKAQGSPDGKANPDVTQPHSGWMKVARGQLALAEVERALYSVDGSPRFFIRVRITNESDRRIGISTKDYSHVIYPNQWSAGDIDHRLSIDEGRATFAKRGGPTDDNLVKEFRSGDVTRIEAPMSVEYYRDFNASTVKNVDATKDKFIIISLGGEILVTDGTQVEALDPKDPGLADFAITTPVQWRKVPSGAVILADRP